METVFCGLVGIFFAVSIYLMLSAHLVRILLGVSIFGNAVNLLIFTAGRLTEAAPPVLAETNADTSNTTAALAGERAGSVAPEAAGAAANGPSAAPPPLHPISPIGPAGTPDGPLAAASDPTAHNAATSALADAAAYAATANPLPQALILTAIVISFSIFAFLLVLTFRAYQALGTDDVDEMRLAEPQAQLPPLGY